VPAAVHVVDAMPTTSGTNGTKIKAAELRRWALEELRWKAGQGRRLGSRPLEQVGHVVLAPELGDPPVDQAVDLDSGQRDRSSGRRGAGGHDELVDG
jgi:hypothetical protein